MEILPAIDLCGGKVVRLLRGDYAKSTTYSEDPAAVARQFHAAGAEWIHMVDLDAARTGQRRNLPLVAAVCREAGVKVELGGGARDDNAIQAMLDAGVSRVVVGSAALSDWEWFRGLVHRPEMRERLALGLDARQGKLAARGWTEQTTLEAVDVASRTRNWPLGAIIYTDIARDGMLEGVNTEATAEIVAATDVPVIASGGVSSLEDVASCRRIGCGGMIVGKAYYEGRVDLAEALRLARAPAPSGTKKKLGSGG